MQIKRVLAVSIAALTAGATLAMGALAIDSLGDYVTTSDGSLTSPIIVVGDGAGSTGAGIVKDVLGAADIAAAVAGFATTEVVSTDVTTSVSGGADISTADNKVYFRSAINKAKNTLTSNDLSTVLAQGTADVDKSGTYKYNQYINLGTKQSAFGDSNGDLTDPALYLDIGSSGLDGSPLYNYTITFNKPLPVNDTDVVGGTMNIAGTDYTIGSSSSVVAGSLALQLFGGANTQTLEEGGEAEVTIDGTTYTVGLLGVSDADTAVVTVNGVSKSMDTGGTNTIEGLDIYLKEVYFLSKESQTSSAKMILGSSQILLQDGAKVKMGSEQENVDGTWVTIKGGLTGLSKITIGVAGGDSSTDYILGGEENAFTDPVFGTFKVAFAGLTPALDSTSRETITVDNAGTTGSTVTFTDYRNNNKQLTWATTESTAFDPYLNASSSRKYVVIEGQNVKENDYVLLAPKQESEFGHIFQLSDVNDIGSTNPSFTLTDAMSTGESTQVYLDKSGYKEFYIDGQAYCAINSSQVNSGGINFFWGSGVTCTAAGADAGTKTTAFPLIKTKNGGYITFVDNRTMFTNATTYELPGNTSTYLDFGKDNISTANQITYGFNAHNGKIGYLQNITTGSSTMMINSFPAILFMQEEDNATTKDFITVDLAPDATNNIKVSAPGLTGTSQSDTLSSDTSVTQYVNTFGTWVESDTDNQGSVTIKYPDTQAVVSVGIGSNPSFSTTGGVTTETALKITAPVSKVASEVSSTSPGADLILIGGPCANTLSAAVLGDDEQCDTWSHTTGIIKEVASAFDDGSNALVVAGTTADNTRSLAAMVMAGTLTYEV